MSDEPNTEARRAELERLSKAPDDEVDDFTTVIQMGMRLAELLDAAKTAHQHKPEGAMAIAGTRVTYDDMDFTIQVHALGDSNDDASNGQTGFTKH